MKRFHIAKRLGAGLRYPGRPSATNAESMPSSPLAGIIRCAACQSTLTQVRATGRGGTYRYLRCTSRGKGVCKAKDVRAEPVEREVAAAVGEVLSGGQYAEALTSKVRGEGLRVNEAREDRTRPLAERDQLRARTEELAVSEPRPSDPVFWAAMRPLTERLAKTEQAIGAIEGRFSAATGQVASSDAILSALAKEGPDLVKASPERQREVYDAVLAWAVLREDRVELAIFPADETNSPPGVSGGGSYLSNKWGP